MLFRSENEDHGTRGGSHPHRGVQRGGNTERSGIAHALLGVMDVEPEWRRHKYSCDIDTTDYTMELPETIKCAIESPLAVGWISA